MLMGRSIGGACSAAASRRPIKWGRRLILAPAPLPPGPRLSQVTGPLCRPARGLHSGAIVCARAGPLFVPQRPAAGAQCAALAGRPSESAPARVTRSQMICELWKARARSLNAGQWHGRRGAGRAERRRPGHTWRATCRLMMMRDKGQRCRDLLVPRRRGHRRGRRGRRRGGSSWRAGPRTHSDSNDCQRRCQLRAGPRRPLASQPGARLCRVLRACHLNHENVGAPRERRALLSWRRPAPLEVCVCVSVCGPGRARVH